jgi:trans-aconitate 2-methyltransferase
MVWDPAHYLKFGNERAQPAVDLLARVPLAEMARAYDLGCGPGNSTALLALRWPNAVLTGVDSDEAMLTRARASNGALSWQKADIAHWQPSQACDLIFSNAALHWLDDHDILFPRLLCQLKAGGVLAVQMPTNHSAASHRVMHDLAHREEWAEALMPVLREDPVLRPRDYYRLLAPHAQRVDIWETTYLLRLTGKDPVLSWIRSTALRPLLEALAPRQAAAFEAAVAVKLREAYAPEKDGTTLFPFRRLFMIAVRRAKDLSDPS